MPKKASTQCGICGRGMRRAAAVQDGVAACSACYQREFTHVHCAKCGKATRSRHGKAPHCCVKCRQQTRFCLRCEKPIEGKAGRVFDDGAVCASCAPHFSEPRPCPKCGQLSLRLSRSIKDGINEAVCDRCRSHATKATCPGCGHMRRPYRFNHKGEMVCRSCYEKGPFTCPKCKRKDVIRHTNHECWDCACARLMRDRIEDARPTIQQEYLFLALRQYGISLLQTEYGTGPLRRFDRDLAFFQRLDALYPAPLDVDAFALCSHFGRNGLRRYTKALGYLNKNGVFPNFDESEMDESSEMAKQNKVLTDLEMHWYQALLSKFHKEMLDDYFRKRRRGHQVSAKSVTQALRAAKVFMQFAEKKCAVTSQTGLVDTVVERFLMEHYGYRFAIRRFIAFLNMRTRQFGGRKLKVATPKAVLVAYGLDVSRQRVLYSQWINAKDEELRRAMIGVFMLIYAQRGKGIARMRLSQVESAGEQRFRVRFAETPLPVDGPEGQLLARYLEQRCIDAKLRNPDDNPYLFPGRRHASHLNAATITGYVRQWRTNADELFGAAMTQIIESGVNSPGFLREGFGVSNATAMHYLTHFGKDAQYG